MLGRVIIGLGLMVRDDEVCSIFLMWFVYIEVCGYMMMSMIVIMMLMRISMRYVVNEVKMLILVCLLLICVVVN